MMAKATTRCRRRIRHHVNGAAANGHRRHRRLAQGHGLQQDQGQGQVSNPGVPSEFQHWLCLLEAVRVGSSISEEGASGDERLSVCAVYNAPTKPRFVSAQPRPNRPRTSLDILTLSSPPIRKRTWKGQGQEAKRHRFTVQDERSTIEHYNLYR